MLMHTDAISVMQMVRFLDGLLKMTYDLWQPSLSGLGMSQCYGTGKPAWHDTHHSMCILPTTL